MTDTDKRAVEGSVGEGLITQPLDLETRKAITGLRKLFQINPGECHLFTRQPLGNERWLSDRYVMLKVEDHAHTSLVTEDAPDGMYKLTAGKGLVPLDTLPPNTPGLLDKIEKTPLWYQMHRTGWSMADDDAKKMLCYAVIPPATPMQGVWHEEPLAINEGIWTQLEEHWRSANGELCPDLRFEYAPNRPYRVSVSGTPIAFVATAKFPEAMREQALAVVEAV